MKSLILDSVRKTYGKEVVLDGMNLEIEAGERIVLLGASGCGKTTVLRLVAGFATPDKGRIILNGEVVAENRSLLRQPEQRNLGLVFQDLALWPHLSVKGNVEFGLKARSIPRDQRDERIAKTLNMVGLEGVMDKKPGELSGGQQQRVALARVLVLEPPLILMDEPLSSLDTQLNVRLRREIIQLQEKLGFTLLYVTHNEAEAQEIATRIVKVSNGRSEPHGEMNSMTPS